MIGNLYNTGERLGILDFWSISVTFIDVSGSLIFPAKAILTMSRNNCVYVSLTCSTII